MPLATRILWMVCLLEICARASARARARFTTATDFGRGCGD
jgi:hypothetical protein